MVEDLCHSSSLATFVSRRLTTLVYRVEKSKVSRLLPSRVQLSVYKECKTDCALLITQKQLIPVFLQIPAQYSSNELTKPCVGERGIAARR